MWIWRRVPCHKTYSTDGPDPLGVCIRKVVTKSFKSWTEFVSGQELQFPNDSGKISRSIAKGLFSVFFSFLCESVVPKVKLVFRCP